MAGTQNGGEENRKAQAQDLNQILRARREKLAALQEAGRDPFARVKYEVTAHSGQIRDRRSPLRAG